MASNTESRRQADAKRDEAFFAERRAREAANLEKTRKLREARLAREAANPPPPKPVPSPTKASAKAKAVVKSKVGRHP